MEFRYAVPACCRASGNRTGELRRFSEGLLTVLWSRRCSWSASVSLRAVRPGRLAAANSGFRAVWELDRRLRTCLDRIIGGELITLSATHEASGCRQLCQPRIECGLACGTLVAQLRGG